MIREKLYITAVTEFHGNFKRFDKLFKSGKISFDIKSLNKNKLIFNRTEMIADDNGNIYNIIDCNIEQGRRYLVLVEFECDIECLNYDVINDNFKFVCKASKLCNAQVIGNTIKSLCIGFRCVSR